MSAVECDRSEEISTNDVRLSGYDRKLAFARVSHTRTLTNTDLGTFKLFLVSSGLEPWGKPVGGTSKEDHRGR